MDRDLLIQDLISELRADRKGDFVRMVRDALVSTAANADLLDLDHGPGWPTWGDKFLYYYGLTGIIADAARACGLGRRTVYHYTNPNDPAYCKEFAEAMDLSRLDAVDMIEGMLRTKAFAGNVRAAMFLLRGNRPEVYGRRETRKMEGEVTVQHDINMPAIRDLLAAKLKALPGPDEDDLPPPAPSADGDVIDAEVIHRPR